MFVRSRRICDQCNQLDKRIAHYREMALHVLDKQILEGIGLLIAKFEADKRGFIPKSKASLS